MKIDIIKDALENAYYLIANELQAVTDEHLEELYRGCLDDIMKALEEIKE